MQSPHAVAWELRDVRKTFGPVVANDGVSLVLYRGQIHGLVGENGSGKSTLIKTLCGVHRPDEGIRAMWRSAGSFGPSDHGTLVGRCHRLSGVLSRSRSDGGREHSARALARAGIQSQLARVARRRRSKSSSDLGIEISPDARVGDLSKAQQQLVEIAKGIAANASIFILDEPTTALGAREIEHLHALLRRMRAAGAAILYISHRLDEVVRLADVVTVMRNGRVVSAADETPLEVAAIVRGMIGKDIEKYYARTHAPIGQPLLDVHDISTAPACAASA